MIRLFAAPPDAVLPGGTIDAQKGYPTADDTPEGRAHAAWWCNERAQTFLWPTDPRGEDEAVMLACLGGDMTPEQVDTPARLVLRLAGRAA